MQNWYVHMLSENLSKVIKNGKGGIPPPPFFPKFSDTCYKNLTKHKITPEIIWKYTSYVRNFPEE